MITPSVLVAIIASAFATGAYLVLAVVNSEVARTVALAYLLAMVTFWVVDVCIKTKRKRNGRRK